VYFMSGFGITDDGFSDIRLWTVLGIVRRQKS
jgi:hypothetical protein